MTAKNEASGAAPSMRWYSDRATLSFIVLRYIPWFAALNLLWEIAQLPLYTLWTNSDPPQIAFAVAHCTLGDIAIGGAALAVALVITRAGSIEAWRRGRIAAITTLMGSGYTAYSEWMNTVALQSWSYSKLMPVLQVGEFELGASPLLQWLLLPAIALWLARVTFDSTDSRP